MAIINEQIETIEQTYWKEVIKQISFEGNSLDKGFGRVVVVSTERQVTSIEGNTSKLDENGNEIYRNISNTLTPPLQLNVNEELVENVEIDGVTTQQVFNFLSKWVDYKKGKPLDSF